MCKFEFYVIKISSVDCMIANFEKKLGVFKHLLVFLFLFSANTVIELQFGNFQTREIS